MDSNILNNSSEFALVEKRIRALTTILAKMGHRQEPSFDLQQVPSLLRHFVYLLTPGDVFSPEVKKAIAATGAIVHDGVNERFQTLMVTQNLYPRSSLTESKLEEVTKSRNQFKKSLPLLIIISNNDVPLNEHISEIWTALASYEPSTDNYIALSRFVINCCRRKLFTRIFLYQKTWHVHVAQKLADWTPAANELPETHWLDAPHWFSLIHLPPDKYVPKRKQGPPDNQVTQLEFSSNTVHLWASFLGHLILTLESHAVEAQKMENEGDTLGFKTAMGKVSDYCAALYCFVSWGAGVVKTLLTKTTLASKFNGFTNGDDLYDSDESDDLNPEPHESSGRRVLRYLKGIVAWHAAISIAYDADIFQITRSELSLSLLEIPHASFDIANLDDIYEAYFNVISLKPSIAYEDLTKPILKRHLPQTFSGTVHAEATLMSLLTYFSSSSSRVAFDMPLRDDHVAALDKLLEPASLIINATTENVVAVGRKCCWCCDRLHFELLKANGTQFKFPGSNGVIYPWSPPRVGVDVKVLQRLEDALFQELHAVISDQSDLLYRPSSGAYLHFSPLEVCGF
ncbi:uncharacterized protein BJ212DRAFT_1469153 [Suillus subaureus]|uniref:Uncharacterized protein n=1 Tax=Suillus subaureus TaxID=48587 RepID=A0A9P7DX97_9AGAM|nr:uncharacterized protein BJ212DRAFT_1469153 [Suillus subaureus]KAG1805175.1 hypothetical protein BJ212DRAFT_1469153 [Suillus subaureus]